MSSIIVLISSTLVSGATQGTPLGHLALMTGRACVHEFNKMTAKKETVLKWLSPQGSEEGSRQKCISPSLTLKEAYLHV